MNIWVTLGINFLAFILFWIVVFLIPHKIKVTGIPQGFVEKQCAINDVTLNYVEGPKNGPPFLLIPGQMESWQGYKAVMPELAKKYHVFSIDLRGHGQSSRAPGHYSYNICGNDLKQFIAKVIGEPVILSGLSSGGVLAVWLAAYAPDLVREVISEDPPMFSSIYPRIIEERYMRRMFQVAIDTLGAPAGPDLEAYLAHSGAPKEGQEELLMIPPAVLKILMALYKVNQWLKPRQPYDVPFLPFEMRVGVKFFMEYDVNFSKATIDGRLSRNFDPVDALKKVKCPMLLMQAHWSRHPYWGLLGAMDAADVQKIRSLVKDVRYAFIDSGHGIHVGEPDWYLQQVEAFLKEVESTNH